MNDAEKIDSRKGTGDEGYDTDKQRRRTGNGHDEFAQGNEHSNAVTPDRIGNHGKDADRSKMHDISRYLEHRFGYALTEVDDQFTFFTDMSDGDAEEASEENDLQHILTSHGIDDITGHDMNGIIDEIDAVLTGRCRMRCIGCRSRQSNADAGLGQVHDQQADGQSNRRRKLKPNDRLAAKAPELLKIAGPGNSHDEGTENKGDDDHLNHPQESVTNRLQLVSKIREQISDQGTNGQTNQNLCTQTNFSFQTAILLLSYNILF